MLGVVTRRNRVSIDLLRLGFMLLPSLLFAWPKFSTEVKCETTPMLISVPLKVTFIPLDREESIIKRNGFLS